MIVAKYIIVDSSEIILIKKLLSSSLFIFYLAIFNAIVVYVRVRVRVCAIRNCCTKAVCSSSSTVAYYSTILQQLKGIPHFRCNRSIQHAQQRIQRPDGILVRTHCGIFRGSSLYVH